MNEKGPGMAQFGWKRPKINEKEAEEGPIFYKKLTLIKVIWFSDVNQYEGHQLKLGQTLPGRRRQGQQVPKSSYFAVDLWGAKWHS